MIAVVESFLRSKKGEDLQNCEDAFVVTEDVCAVIDGATSPTGRLWTSKQWTGGQWAAHILKEAILVQQSVGGNDDRQRGIKSARDWVDYLTDAIREAYEREGVLELMRAAPEERATASFVLFSKSLGQLIFVGDCQAALLTADMEYDNADRKKILRHIQHTKWVDTVTSQARAMFLQAELLQLLMQDGDGSKGVDSKPSEAREVIQARFRKQQKDTGREFIQPLLKMQRRFQNNPAAPEPYQFWVMDGFPVSDQGIHVYNVSPPSSSSLDAIVKGIVLASDGYPKLFPTLLETETYLHKCLCADPLQMEQILGTKGIKHGNESFDDRTYLRVELDYCC